MLSRRSELRPRTPDRRETTSLSLVAFRRWFCLVLLGASAGACAEEVPPEPALHPHDAGATEDSSVRVPADHVTGPSGPGCMPLESEEPIPARTAVMSGAESSGEKTVFVNDLFLDFKSNCGGCHVD